MTCPRSHSPRVAEPGSPASFEVRVPIPAGVGRTDLSSWGCMSQGLGHQASLTVPGRPPAQQPYRMGRRHAHHPVRGQRAGRGGLGELPTPGSVPFGRPETDFSPPPCCPYLGFVLRGGLPAGLASHFSCEPQPETEKQSPSLSCLLLPPPPITFLITMP